MALHRKQRGPVDLSPQYVRIPTLRANGRSPSYSLHETHPRSQRIYAKRYTTGDRSRKISSVQLRVCFALCVLLYFGAIYFADDIASFGRVVGSEQNSQNFFVHSLMPRGRGNIRVGRAVDAKKMEATSVPVSTTATPAGVEKQQQEGNTPTEAHVVETHLPETEYTTAKTEEAQATEPLQQPETEVHATHQGEQKLYDDAPGDAVHPDDQGEDIAADHIESVKPDLAENTQKPVEKLKTISTDLSKPNNRHQGYNGKQQKDPIATAPPKNNAPGDQLPHPTAALRLPEKEADVVPAASPARVEKQDDKLKWQRQPNVVGGQLEGQPIRQVNRGRKPIEEPNVAGGQHGEQQTAETTQTTPVQKESAAEHISDI